MHAIEVMLCLVSSFSPEYFALPPEKTCEAFYKRTLEIEKAYETFGGFALQQQRDQIQPIKRYWWAAWWVRWKAAAPPQPMGMGARNLANET